MQTTQSATTVQWYACLHEAHASILPPDFFVRGSKHRPNPRNSTQTSQMFSCKTSFVQAMPRIVPSFNLTASVLDETDHGKWLKTFNALKAAYGIKAPSITSDDALLCLDYGCSITITNDVLDFKAHSEKHNIPPWMVLHLDFQLLALGF